ncbi:MFS transporter [Streptomyces sp. NPDC048581]|uniref:MFS transporter n=1 Tax=Streptomyces sp. NPDC048581 TaxID=3365572 RepID=UPI003724477C
MTTADTASTAAAPQQSAAVRMTGRQVTALVVLLTSTFMMAADFSVLNVALPKVGVSLGFSTGNLQWITTTFALCAAGCTLVFGRVGDYVGRRRVFIVGMVVLAASSLLGGIASSPGMLLTARTLQGLATAAVLPSALALLTTAFTDPALRTRALGLNSVMMSSGFSVGAVLGGVLTDLFSWRWAFFINIPVAVAAMLLVPVVVPESRAEARSRIDLPGAVLITLGLFATVYGVTRIGEDGLDAVAAVATFGGLVLLALFWVVESRTAEALVPVRILKKPEVAYGNLGALFIFSGETALIFFTGLYVQNVLGLSPLAGGLVLLGIGVGQIIAGTVGPRILQRVDPRTFLGISLALQGAFMIPTVFAGDQSWWLAPLVATQFVNGFFSMTAALSFMVIATSSVDTDMQGMATGMATQSQQVSAAIGIPLVSTVFVAVIGTGAVSTAEELHGIQVAVALVAVVQIVVGALLWAVLRRKGAEQR